MALQLNKGSTRSTLIDFFNTNRIRQEDQKQALLVSHVYPTLPQWRSGVDLSLLVIGSLALAFSLIFFIAANWQSIERFGKFALIESCMLVPILVYWKYHKHPLYGQLSLIGAFLACGGLMAFFGQTYQTGADPWQLFFNWALLTTPWVLIARSASLWLLWLTLLQLSIMQYFDSGQIIRWSQGYNEDISIWSSLLLNIISLSVWQWRTFLDKHLNQWPIQVIVAAILMQVNYLFLEALFSSDIKWLNVSLAVVTSGCIFAFYRFKKLDLMILAGLGLTAVIFINAVIIKLMPNSWSADFFILNAIAVLATGSGVVMWLKTLASEQHNG